MIHVSIIEDDLLVAKNLERYLALQVNFEVGIIAHSAEDFLAALDARQKHNVLLLDIGLPGMSGLEALPKVLKKYPKLEIIMLTTFEEEDIVLKAMCLGAVAYLSKRTPLNKIVEAINVVHRGGSYMSPMIARDIFNHIYKKNTKKETLDLTERQLEILEKIVAGKSYTTIGKELFISPETVRTHIKNIYKSLKVNNKAEAVAKYLQSH